MNFSFEYPDSWSVDQALLDADGPVVIASFPVSARSHSGALPAGGIEVTIRNFPGTVDDNALLVPSRTRSIDVSRSVQTANHRGMLRADYAFQFSEQATYRATSGVVRIGDRVFSILVLYEQRTPSSSDVRTGEAALNGIVSTLVVGGTK